MATDDNNTNNQDEINNDKFHNKDESIKDEVKNRKQDSDKNDELEQQNKNSNNHKNSSNNGNRGNDSFFILKIIIIILLAFSGYGYYSYVLPDTIAKFTGILFAIVMLVSMLFRKVNLGILFTGGATIFLWPAGALLITYLVGNFDINITRAQSIAMAPFIAAIVASITCSFSQKRDQSRDLATISLAIICLYTIFYVCSTGENYAQTISCFSIAFSTYIIKQLLIVPPLQEKGLSIMILVPFSSGLMSLITLPFLN